MFYKNTIVLYIILLFLTGCIQRYPESRYLIVKPPPVVDKHTKDEDNASVENNTTEEIILTPQELEKQKFMRNKIAKQKKRYYRKIVKKRVRDDNYSARYMYPENSKKHKTEFDKTKKEISMTKDECISIIGKEKFMKYSSMFGSDNAAIKRCLLMRSKR